MSTTSRITSGEELKQRNGLAGLRDRGIALPYAGPLTGSRIDFDSALEKYLGSGMIKAASL